MGFFDSLKTGLGRVFEFGGEILEKAAPIFGPPLVEAGISALRGALNLQPQGQFGSRGPASFDSRTFARPQTFSLPGGAMVNTRVATPQAFNVLVPPGGRIPDGGRFSGPSPSPIPFGQTTRPAPGTGGTRVGAFPGSRGIVDAVFADFQPGNGGAAPFSFDIPFTDFRVSPDLPLVDVTRRAPVGGCPTSPFRQTQMGAASQKFIGVNPVTGRATWFGPLGSPVLFSRDFAVMKRLRRVAVKAGRARGRR